MARLESGMMQLKNEWCDIQEIIGVALRRESPIFQDRKINITIPEDIPLIRADFVLLEQAVTNLLDNAHKYSKQDKEVIIEVKQISSEVQVSITNNGVSIPESDREKIFEKFYRLTTNQHITGTGLGLSICKGIIEAHGGRIWVEAKEEKVIFTFTLPIVSMPPDIPSAKEGE
jgi:two-component system sensor histidine kinase KdpD